MPNRRTDLPRFMQEILQSKGLIDPEAIENFLNPRLDQLRNPFLMLHMSEAADIVVRAIIDRTPILLWGDYDVDGVTGTTLLVLFLRELGVEATWYVPDRFTEGYGLNISSFQNHFAEWIDKKFLLITIDCGISDDKAIAAIQSFGGTVIVTDHHQLPAHDLPACTLLNHNQEECGFHKEQLAGVGVAFYFAAAIRSRLDQKDFFQKQTKPNLKTYLPLVAIGTLADVAYISATNRILIRAGLEELEKTGLLGLRAILNKSGLSSGAIFSEDIGFLIGPLLNAAGRIANASLAVELLISKTLKTAEVLVNKIFKINNDRKVLCGNNLDLALHKLQGINTSDRKTIVLSGQFHVGVAGIIAGKLCDLFNKPVLILAECFANDTNEYLKGSGRSLPGTNLFLALQYCDRYLDHYGGHECAAGLTLSSYNLQPFSDAFEEYFCNSVFFSKTITFQSNYLRFPIKEVMQKKNLSYFRHLEPFGEGNPRPMFIDNTAEIVYSRVLGGRGEHMQVLVRGDQENYRGIAFHQSQKWKQIQENSNQAIIYTPTLNRYKGESSWQIRVEKIL